ncbi:MAG: hypothetical protein PHV81_04480 [Candidatus Methanomethylophilaceae archaeon]|jgi:hypothetical protein|nr:hypothetical protein [Candidatus Methanomethylophilaceae archaeon]NCA74195.1 hypothetical protein [Gammaproteobacteria bacterium]MDD3351884.1 hypothetical protein [Candidatus Methanomethylophilaceae archaeon]MDD3986261.1 hypothetical protein [Candidatus Methanomethylophilaceae archaeon]MDD4709360.1 hypothetical protein [Candidatus Methanomethylophilaceae archaeon]
MNISAAFSVALCLVISIRLIYITKEQIAKYGGWTLFSAIAVIGFMAGIVVAITVRDPEIGVSISVVILTLCASLIVASFIPYLRGRYESKY